MLLLLISKTIDQYKCIKHDSLARGRRTKQSWTEVCVLKEAQLFPTSCLLIMIWASIQMLDVHSTDAFWNDQPLPSTGAGLSFGPAAVFGRFIYIHFIVRFCARGLYALPVQHSAQLAKYSHAWMKVQWNFGSLYLCLLKPLCIRNLSSFKIRSCKTAFFCLLQQQFVK